MNLSIVIVNWNTRANLAECLSSIDHARSSSGSPTSNSAYELFVVDNASTDGSAEMVREQFPWVHLIPNAENVGFASANNQALRRASGRYVVLLNSDTAVHPGALETMMAFMGAHPRAGGCGPQLLNADGSLQLSCHPVLTPGREFWRLMFLERLWRRATYPQGRWNPRQARRVEVVKGACLMLRSEALDEVGLLDDRYFVYTEEMDLCYRLLQADWELWWVPQAVVTHYGEASSRQMAREMYVQLYRSKVQFYRKFGGPRRADRFKRLMRLAYLPRLAVAILCAPFLPSLLPRARTYRRLLAELPGM